MKTREDDVAVWIADTSDNGLYLDEAIQSGLSMEKRMPFVGRVLIVPNSVNMEELDCDKFPFNHILKLMPKINKINYMMEAMRLIEGKYFLFLHTDTSVILPIYELFDLLRGNAGVFSTIDKRKAVINGSKLPSSFPIPDVGVLGISKSVRNITFLDTWLRRDCVLLDAQRSLRDTLYDYHATSVFINDNYNLRYKYPFAVSGVVKIIHGRPISGHGMVGECINIDKNQRSKTW